MKYIPDSARAPARIGKPATCKRRLLNTQEAIALGRLFKVFANDTRLRLLHALERGGELFVNDLGAQIDMAPQAVSNQLQRLADRGIVVARREGTRLYYRIADPCVAGFLDLGLCLLEETARNRRAQSRGAAVL